MSLTKEDFTNIESIVHSIVSDSEKRLMRELAKKADKVDVDRMESRIVASIGIIERDYNFRISALEQRLTQPGQ